MQGGRGCDCTPRPSPGMLDIGWALSAPGVTAILHAPMLGMTSGTAVAGAAMGGNGGEEGASTRPLSWAVRHRQQQAAITASPPLPPSSPLLQLRWQGLRIRPAASRTRGTRRRASRPSEASRTTACTPTQVREGGGEQGLKGAAPLRSILHLPPPPAQLRATPAARTATRRRPSSCHSATGSRFRPGATGT